MWRSFLMVGCLLGISACDILSGHESDQVPLSGERYAVLLGKGNTQPDPLVAEEYIDIPAPQRVNAWEGNFARSTLANIEISNPEDAQRATIGEGYDFDDGLAPIPVASPDTVYAMDAAGHISAHALDDIDTIRWQSDALRENGTTSMLGGGLFIDTRNNRLYAASGFGQLAALDAITGETQWKIRLGGPVRGAPAADNTHVVVLTADNQTIALRASDGQTSWEHRGIRENAGFFSTVAPIIWQGTVLVAYSSGEVVALNAQTGGTVWTDTLITKNRTQAAAAFTGINATPLVQDGAAYLISASGNMLSNALLNGRPLWEADVASAQPIWGAGNMLFLLTPQHELVGMLKKNGAVRWVQQLGEYNRRGVDETPKLFPPMLINGYVVVANVDGTLRRFDALNGEEAEPMEISSGLAAPFISVDGRLLSVHQNATLRVSER
jgi:outer membrane protein assembly factor BamB